MPMVFPLALAPNGWLTLTLGSVYFWGLFALWLNRMRVPAARQQAAPEDFSVHASLSPFSLAALVLIGLVVGGSAIAAARQSVRDDPAVGTWVLDRTKSTLPPDLPIDSRTITFTLIGDAIDQTIVTLSNGIERRVEYRGRYDGKDILIPNALPPIVALKRLDKHTVESTGRIGDQVVETQIRSVSADGRTLTISVATVQSGVERRSVQVYDRQS
jgi:hypothetical protein